MVEYDPGSHANCGICEPLEQEEDTDSEAEAYGNPTASNEPLRPWQEQNYTIGVGSSAESLLGNQMKTNPRFLRDIAKLLIGNEEGSPIMIGGFTPERPYRGTWQGYSTIRSVLGNTSTRDQTSDVIILAHVAQNVYKG